MHTRDYDAIGNVIQIKIVDEFVERKGGTVDGRDISMPFCVSFSLEYSVGCLPFIFLVSFVGINQVLEKVAVVMQYL